MLSSQRIGTALGAFLILIGFCGVPRDAHADYTQGTSCTAPAAAGISGSTNGSSVVQPAGGNNLVCVSGTWQYPNYILGSTSTAAGGSCSTAGALHYNTTISNVEYCNGTNWTQLAEVQGSQPPTAPSGSGYFVMSKSTFAANLGGQTGANAACLTELTTNTGWAGYSSANSNGQLVSSHVHAFLCYDTAWGNTCSYELNPLTTYYFADANNSSHGGASFTTDSSGYGPYDNANWAAANRFGSNYTYWIGGRGSVSTSEWGSVGVSGSGTCLVFTSTSSGYTGTVGDASNTDSNRWNTAAPACNNSYNLICVVDPP